MSMMESGEVVMLMRVADILCKEVQYKMTGCRMPDTGERFNI